VAATSEATVRSAAQHGVPFILGFPFPDEVKTQLLDVYRQTAAADLYAGGEHWVSAVVHFARSKEQALRELRSSFVPWNLRAAAATAWLEPPAHTPGSAQWEEIIGMQALGTPEDVAERLVALTQLSGTENLLLAADGTLEPAQTLENLERLAVEVRPMLVGSSQQAVRGAP
jgi:alkanesulfonate monooxygenase SsuD/methylene tetrahydromethanopterin reductase-like flavin-dependent oxidoreductase (luciferase family)